MSIDLKNGEASNSTSLKLAFDYGRDCLPSDNIFQSDFVKLLLCAIFPSLASSSSMKLDLRKLKIVTASRTGKER